MPEPQSQEPNNKGAATTTLPKPKKGHSLEHRAGGAMFWNVVFLPLKAALGLFASVFLVRKFHFDAYASLAVVTSFQTTLGLYIDLGIERALPRFVAEVEATFGQVGLRRFILLLTNIKLIVLAVLVVGIAIFTDPLLDALKSGDSSWETNGRLYLAMVCALLMLGAFYDVCTQILYSFFKQKITNLLDIIVTVINPLLTILFVWLNWQVLGVILALLLTTLISVLIAAWQAFSAAREATAIREANTKPRPTLAAQPEPPGTVQASLPVSEVETEIETEKASAWLKDELKTTQLKTTPELAAADSGSNPARRVTEAKPKTEGLVSRFVRYTALMYFFNISAWFYDVSFAVLIFQFFGNAPGVVAFGLVKLVYGFIKQLLKTLLTPFNGVQTPLFSAIRAEKRDSALQTAYVALTKLQIFLLLPSGLGIVILSRNLMALLYMHSGKTAVLNSDNLTQAAWATALTVVLSFAESIISTPMTILMVYEKYKLVIISRIIPLLTGPFLIVCAVMHWGVISAVLVMGGLAVLSRVVTLIGIERDLKLIYPYSFMWKVTKATAVFVVPLGVIAYLLPASWPATIAITVVGGLIFVVVFKMLGGFDVEDKDRLASMKIPFKKYIIKYL